MRTSASFRLLAMGLTLAGVSLLTACGGDAPAPSATAPAAPAPAAAPAAAPAPAAPAATTTAANDPHKMMTELGCAACHKVDAKLVGPSYQDVAKKYAGQKDAKDKLVTKVLEGGSGVWGPVAMAPNKANPLVTKEKVETMVEWILAGAK